MRINDIKDLKADKIVSIEDWVDYNSYWYSFEYRWEKDDGDKHLMAWVSFSSMKSLMSFFSEDLVEECPYDFECIARPDCVVFPHFETALEHLELDETDIKRIFS